MSNTPSWIDEIEVKFTYDIPDRYLEPQATEGKKGEFTYIGPEKIYVFVDNETNKIQVNMDAWAYDEENPTQLDEVTLFAGLSHTPVLVDATKQTLLATLIWMDGEPHENYPCKAWRDPDTNEVLYWETSPLIPDDAYNQEEIEYNPQTKEFVRPFPFETPGMSQEEWDSHRQHLISTAEDDLSQPVLTDPANSDKRAKLVAYKEELENIWTKFSYAEGWRHWHIRFPKHPFGDTAEGNQFDAEESIDPDRSTVDNN